MFKEILAKKANMDTAECLSTKLKYIIYKPQVQKQMPVSVVRTKFYNHLCLFKRGVTYLGCWFMNFSTCN